jgi:energy-converting hydrogenase Eha subunit E
MTKERVEIISTILMTVGVLLLLAMAFELVPQLERLTVFIAVACFVIAGMIRSISKIKEKYNKN